MRHYERFRWAEDLFAHRDYIAAGFACGGRPPHPRSHLRREPPPPAVRPRGVLEHLLDDLAHDPEQVGHGVTGARELLARAYYHSAQLRRAESATCALLAEDATNAYVALLLARTLQGGSRHEEAERAFSLAAALGAPGMTMTSEPEPVEERTR